MPRNKRSVNLRTQVLRSFDDSYAEHRMYQVQITKRRTDRRTKHGEAWERRWDAAPTRKGVSTPRRQFGQPLLKNGRKHVQQ